MMYKKREILYFCFCFILLSFAFHQKFCDIKKNIQYEKLKSELITTISAFHGEVGLYIKDLKTGMVIVHNENKLFPSASVVKVPIMACVFQQVAAGNLNLQDKLVLRNSYKAGGSGKLKRYRSGKKFSLIELLELMIIESDNTATNIVTDKLGFSYINSAFENEFKFKWTRLERDVMDLKARQRGIENYTTAKEMGKFLEKIYRGKIINKTISKEMLEILSKQKHTDRIPRYLPNELIVAHKTGLLRGVCHDAGIVFTPQGDFVICVLTSDFQSTKLAKVFIGEMAYKTYRYY